MTPAQLDVLSMLLVNGSLQMMWYASETRGQYGPAMWDLSTIGREIARPWGYDWQDQASQQVIITPAMLQSEGATALCVRRGHERGQRMSECRSAIPVPSVGGVEPA